MISMIPRFTRHSTLFISLVDAHAVSSFIGIDIDLYLYVWHALVSSLW